MRVHTHVGAQKWPKFKRPKASNIHKSAEQQRPFSTADGIGKWYNHFGKLLAVLPEDEYMQHCDPVISLIGVNQIDVSHQKTCKIVHRSFIHYNPELETI